MKLNELLERGILLISDQEIDLKITFCDDLFLIYGGNHDGDYILFQEEKIDQNKFLAHGFKYLKTESEFILNDIKTDFFEGQYNECVEN